MKILDNACCFYLGNCARMFISVCLKTSIIFIPGTIDTHAPLIVLKTCTCVSTPEMPFLAVR